MCELLVAAVNSHNPDSVYQDTKLPKRGDVVAAREDGWPWGADELTDPAWRLLSIPGAPVQDFLGLLSPEPATSPEELLRPNTLQYRGWFLDDGAVDVPPDFAAYIADDARTDAIYRVPPGITLAQVVAKRPAVADPAVIGDDPRVIG